MKCHCEECNGSGSIRCPECNGEGEVSGRIEHVTLISSMHNYAELKELQKDASRVIRQAARLKELNPNRASAYDAQLGATLDVINELAEKEAKRK